MIPSAKVLVVSFAARLACSLLESPRVLPMARTFGELKVVLVSASRFVWEAHSLRNASSRFS